jgi:SAM-dependent methyltransferase
MTSFPSDIPALIRSLEILEYTLDDLDQSMQRVVEAIDKLDAVSKNAKEQLSHQFKNKINRSFLDQAISDINDQISLQEQQLLDFSSNEYCKKDRAWFISNLTQWPNDKIFDKEGIDYLKLRLSNFNDFRHNGLEIGCGKGYWYEWLAALSPLYQVDINWNFFSEIASQFQPLFFAKDRMRFVKTTGTNLPEVTDNTIDFVFSWNTFNFLPVDVINEYLISIHRAMKPGAYAIIGYTNAYRDDSYQQVLKGHWAYNNSKLIHESIAKIGFEPRALFETGLCGSWIEFTKSGTKIHTVDYPKPGTGYCKKVF